MIHTSHLYSRAVMQRFMKGEWTVVMELLELIPNGHSVKVEVRAPVCVCVPAYVGMWACVDE